MALQTATRPADLHSSLQPWSLDAAARTTAGKAVIVVTASLFVAVCAHVSFPLPFTPVPVTLSDLAVLLVGLMLGPQMAFAALALYLAEGASGLPVFSPTGPGGLAQFIVSGGYLVAYPFAAAVAGFVARALKGLPRYAAGALAATAATTLIMASGAAWMGLGKHLPAGVTFDLAVLPFIPVQMAKVASAAGLYAALQRFGRS